MDVIILAFKLSVITRKMFNFSEMCVFEGHKSATTVAGSWEGRARILGRSGSSNLHEKKDGKNSSRFNSHSFQC